MSFILDALKKAEQERRRGAVPDLQTVLDQEPARERKKRPWWPYLLLPVLLLNGSLLLWWLHPWRPAASPGLVGPAVALQDGIAAGAPPAAIEPVPVAAALPAANSSIPIAGAAPAVKTEAALPSLPAPPGAMPVPEPAAPPATEPAPPPPLIPVFSDPSLAEELSGPLAENPEPEPAAASDELDEGQAFAPESEEEDFAASESSFSGLPDPEEEQLQELQDALEGLQQPAAQAEDSGAAAVDLDRLPAAVREGLPEIVISFHLYSQSPTARMASINGRLMREGQAVAPGLVLEQIVPEGAVFSAKGKRFRIKVF